MLSSDPERARQQREELEKRHQRADTWALHSALEDLHRAVELGYDQLETTLRRRGHLPIERGIITDTLVPFEAGYNELPWDRQRYLDLFGKASFRKVVRKLIAGRNQPVPIAQLQAIAGIAAEDYINLLGLLGVAERLTDSVRLSSHVDNIGPTLEWYVAQICRRELHGSAEWSVKLEGLPTGGDYDVLAWLDPLLMYVETKSAAPAEVTESQLKNFLQRTEELAPDLAVLLVDTSDDLADLRERLLQAMLPVMRKASRIEDPNLRPDRPFIRSQEDFPGISFGYRRIYVTNSKPAILTQLRRCLQHYHIHVKGMTFLSGPPVNFVTGYVGKER